MDGQAPKRSIMEPFNFSTFLERNLSASWYRDIPTIKVDANFDTIKVGSLTVTAYISLLCIARNNFESVLIEYRYVANVPCAGTSFSDIPCRQKFSPGENFCQFRHLLSLVKFIIKFCVLTYYTDICVFYMYVACRW